MITNGAGVQAEGLHRCHAKGAGVIRMWAVI
jgi:hypothetical protein